MKIIHLSKTMIVIALLCAISSCDWFMPTYSIEIMNMTPDSGGFLLTPAKEKYYEGEEVIITITVDDKTEFCGWYDQELEIIDELNAKFVVDGQEFFFISFYSDEVDYYEAVTPNNVEAAPSRNGFYFQTGLIKPSDEDFSKVRIAPNIDTPAVRTMSRSYSLLAYNEFPRPLSQGAQGSCTAWAVGFAAKSYFEKKKQGWNLGYKDCASSYAHNFEHIFSPAFIYNQINNGEDSGSAIISALELLEDKGICTWASMPYDDTDYLTQPSTAAFEEAQFYKIEGFYKINQTYGSFSSTEIANIKSYLDNGSPVLISVDTDTNMLYPEMINEIGEYVWSEKGIASGSHAMCIIGYDDNYGFRVMNSWSAYWGNNGFIWIDIDFFQNEVGNSAYVIVDY